MLFELSGASALFQRLMDRICHDLLFTPVQLRTYLDNLLIYSQTLQDHKEYLHILFEHLSQAGLTLRGEKSTIGLTKVKYLGHTFSAKAWNQILRKYQLLAIARSLIMLESYTELRGTCLILSLKKRLS